MTIQGFASSGFAVDDPTLCDTPGMVDEATGNIYAVFAPAVIIGLPPKQKAPLDDRWKRLRWENTEPDQYRQSLWTSSIGIVSGAVSYNLCGIQFDAYAPFREFIAANPLIGETLITAGPDEIVAWLRLRDFYPPTLDLDGCKWESQGVTKIFGRNELGSEYSFINFCKPSVIEFNTLNWNSVNRTKIRPYLIAQKRGPVTRFDKKRDEILNENFWAEYFVGENPCQYAPGLQKFLRPGPKNGDWKPVCDEVILSDLQEFLIAKADTSMKMHRFCNQWQLRQILNALRLIAPIVETVTEVEVLGKFLKASLEKQDGYDVTVSELFSCYEQYCHKLGRSALPNTEFVRLIPGLMRTNFGIAKSKSIQRNGANKRGFRNIQLKTGPG